MILLEVTAYDREIYLPPLGASLSAGFTTFFPLTALRLDDKDHLFALAELGLIQIHAHEVDRIGIHVHEVDRIGNKISHRWQEEGF